MKIKSWMALAALAAAATPCLASAQALPAYPTTFDDEVETATLMRAWDRALAAERRGQFQFVRSERREEFLQRLRGAGVAAAAESAGVEAALGGAPEASSSLRDQLVSEGLRNEQRALTDRSAARAWEAPRADGQGIYYSYAQTLNYAHNTGSDPTSLYEPDYYAQLRCRAALREGPLSGHTAWRYWRVCPDEQGRYRPTL